MPVSKNLSRGVAGAAAALALALAGDAAADVLFTSGPTVGTVNAVPMSAPITQSQKFTTVQAGAVKAIAFGAWLNPSNDLISLDWAIMSNAQSLGGQVLYAGSADDFEKIAFTGPGAGLGRFDVFTFTFETPDLLLAAGDYWLRLVAKGATSSLISWDWTGLNEPGVGELAVGDSPPTLENGRNTFTIYGEFQGAPGAVPEPATWAMMIVGFGLAGRVLRRRGTLAI